MLGYIVRSVSYVYSLVANILYELNELNMRLLCAYNGCDQEEEHYNSF